ncbi:MAG TPA: hypothetical protein VGS78_05595, partial [Candidatus Sulfotelmatobacter sp.]|nr:hypothetical protein [Candidatus Sulfotelmatobacter sp.]
SNVAAGYKALNNDTTGSFNVAVGNFAGQSGDGSPMTGNNNTFVGGGAEASYGSNGSGPLTNATAVGSNAVVGESNALVLGSVCCLNNATSNTKVGIGTTTPGATLDVEAPAGTGAPTVNIGNSANNAVVNVTGTLNLNGQSIGSGSGISTINTPLGSGLAGGGNSSTLNLSLASAGCTAGQVMSWTGSLWACSTVSGGGGGSGTVTSVAGGTGIVTTPSPITGAGTVAIDPTVVPQLGAANNNFTGNENVTGSISVVPNAYMNAMTASGFSAAYGSQGGGSNAIQAFGGTGDSSSTTPGGMGIFSEGGGGGVSDGDGGSFVGGYGASSSGFGDGIHAVAGSGYAGNFYGDLNVTGAITAGTKDFKIDHPLDPANKYLVHASVESSEMMNIYTGNVVTDAEGNASVDLPEWFEALNTDFRYQLTVIGQFAQAIVANEVANNRFSIRTDKPNVKVSWQITAIRHDAFAKAHPLVVEQEKEARLKGYYIHPELHGAPAEKQIEWARHPELMQRIKQSHVRKTTAKANPRNSSNAFR